VLTALSQVDDSVSLEEDKDFFDDEELEVSSLSSLLSSPFSFALSAFSSVSSVLVVFFACVDASVGNAALSAVLMLSFVFMVPSFAVFVVCVAAAVLSRVSRKRCCNSALRPSMESPHNCKAFLSSATLINYWNCGAT